MTESFTPNVNADNTELQTEELNKNITAPCENGSVENRETLSEKTKERVEEELAVTAAIPLNGTFVPVDGGESLPAKKKKEKVGFKKGVYLFVKRTFDVVSSGLFILVLSPLYILLAILVKCSDGGSVFYRHPRVGKNGKKIYVAKFRSMKKNADRLEDMLTPEQLEAYHREYKLDDDPRITKIGGFLRKTSLDELPNVFSIFKGDLSVVGPRPLMEDEVREKFGADSEKLLSVKPGMIGYWAANGRSNCTYESGERQKMELFYVDHCSVWMDIKIMFKTVFGVLRRDGAK